MSPQRLKPQLIFAATTAGLEAAPFQNKVTGFKTSHRTQNKVKGFKTKSEDSKQSQRVQNKIMGRTFFGGLLNSSTTKDTKSDEGWTSGVSLLLFCRPIG